MPFTVAHAAAALPFRHLRLVPSAVVVGTLAPDFEYFLRLAPRGGFGHTVEGAFLLSLPLALLVLWMFHAIVKAPLIRLFPKAIRLRLRAQTGKFRFGGVRRFLLIAVSVLIGIATHLLWDSMTHRDMWPARHWPLLRRQVHLPGIGSTHWYTVFQHGSTVIGMLIICAWLVIWYRSTEPRGGFESNAIRSRQRSLILLGITGAALCAGVVRARIALETAELAHRRETAIGLGVVTFIGIAWWLLVAYAIVAAKLVPKGRSLEVDV